MIPKGNNLYAELVMITSNKTFVVIGEVYRDDTNRGFTDVLKEGICQGAGGFYVDRTQCPWWVTTTTKSVRYVQLHLRISVKPRLMFLKRYGLGTFSPTNLHQMDVENWKFAFENTRLTNILHALSHV